MTGTVHCEIFEAIKADKFLGIGISYAKEEDNLKYSGMEIILNRRRKVNLFFLIRNHQ
jgi:hypothetical protein